ncbi:MAG: SHOCT domain-containing protein [Burkholderiaceae bacterium]|nr:SHOCT domain-containing protein [Burkholderiaceae bacterium]
MFYGDMMGMHALWWIFWIVLVIALVSFWGWGTYRERRGQPRETPHEVLRRRLANGEISTEEYTQRKAVLDRDTP